MPGAAMSAIAITVSCGLTVLEPGKTLASQTYRLSKPWTLQSGPTTPRPSSTLIALPPCGWPDPTARSLASRT
jgi:hypothetical protein